MQEFEDRHANPSGLADGDLRKRAQPLRRIAPQHHAELHKRLLARELPGIRWVPSPNYSPGRDGHNPNWTAADPNSWIVLHTMVGWMNATITAFQSPARQASAHYLVGLDGSIVQMVHENDAAWTNGDYADVPGDNLDSITIEGEDGGDFNGPRTPAFYEAYAELVADIAQRTGIPLVHRGIGGGVLGHKECKGAQTSCPDGLDLLGIIARAVEINAPPPPPPPPPAPGDTPAAATYQLVKSIPLVTMATDANTAKVVGPGVLTTAYRSTNRPVEYAITQYSHDHSEGLGLRISDIDAAVAPPAPPPPEPPPPTPPPPDPNPPKPPSDLWPWLQALLDWLKRVFGA